MLDIRKNFEEILQSIKFPSENRFPLVANYSSTRIYDSRYGWGRLWTWFHRIECWLTGRNLHASRMEKALLHTQTVFKTEIVNIQKQVNLYSEYLNRSGKGYALNETHYFQARSLITEWNSSTKPFLHHLKKMPSPQPLKELFPSNTLSITRTYQRIIDLEGFLNGPLPLTIFKKIIREISLNPIDEKDLARLAAKIDKCDIPSKTLHKALKSITTVYAKKQVSNKPLKTMTVDLELLLEDKGCQTLQKEDPKHLLWRQNLAKGQNLSVNGTEIILAEEIFPKVNGSDQTRAYLLEGIPDRLALIAQNQIALPLRERRMRKETGLGIEPAWFTALSSDGRIALVEKLQQITAEDNRIILSLCRLIKKFIENDMTPSNFSFSNVMFDAEGRLKSIKPLTRSPFDYNALEDFLKACAGENASIYKELMVKSGLSTHKTAKFYQDIIRHALKGDPIAADDLAGIYKIGDPKVVDRAILLAQKALDLKKQFMLEVRMSSPKLTPAAVEKKAVEMVLAADLS